MRGFRIGPKKRWNYLLAVLQIYGCLDCTLVPQAFAQRTPVEYQLKASYLRRIPNFVQWPSQETNRSMNLSDPVRLCVVGSYGFGTLLAQEANKPAAQGNRMEVRWIHKEMNFRGCQIVFVSRSEQSSYGKILSAARGMSALTVGETDGFVEAGGILELDFQNDTLKFQVNLQAAQASQLKLDARLLAMAQRVIRQKEQSGT